MNWKLRSRLLRLMANCPGGMGVYQFLQARLGTHCRPAFVQETLRVQHHLAQMVLRHGGRVERARIMEVGTGWVPLAPLGWWLCGADRIHTYDLNRYLLPRVLTYALRWMGEHSSFVVDLYRDVQPEALLRQRVAELAALAGQPWRALAHARVEYHAPADAASTGLPGDAIDLHFSMHVFEHVPAPVLGQILAEARRVLAPGGVAVHHIDPSDHFAHNDPSIARVHFLRFGEKEWRQHGGHRLAYHNRLRDGDFRRLFRESGLTLLEHAFRVDEQAEAALRAGFPLDASFHGREPAELCREELDFLMRKEGPAVRAGGLVSGTGAAGRPAGQEATRSQT